MKKRVIERKKNFIYIGIVLLVLIVIYLLYPTKTEVDSKNLSENFSIDNNVKVNQLIDYKYLYLTKKGLLNFSKTKIADYNNEFLTNLIYSNKVFDKDDTLAQEVLYFYLINKTNLSKKITNIFFTKFLQEYDTGEKIKWRNQVIILIDPYKNRKITLFNKSSLLVSYEKSIYKGESKLSVALYNKIAYFLYFKNGTIHSYNISLTDKDAILKIRNEIYPNNKFNQNLKDVKTKYYYSNKKYYLLFKIWKS